MVKKIYQRRLDGVRNLVTCPYCHSLLQLLQLTLNLMLFMHFLNPSSHPGASKNSSFGALYIYHLWPQYYIPVYICPQLPTETKMIFFPPFLKFSLKINLFYILIMIDEFYEF